MPSPHSDTDLTALDLHLRRLRRRAIRLHRETERGRYNGRPGRTIDSRGSDRQHSALGLTGIAIKISALQWFLAESDAILDAGGLRQLSVGP